MSQPRLWSQYPVENIPRPPAMLGGEEIQFLYHVAKDRYTGRGEIVDAGAFVGASAAAMGAGLRDNAQVGDKRGRIFSYDFFEYGDCYKGYVPQFGKRNGDDTLDVFRHYTADFADMIVPVKGDICKSTWDGRPIEILFVDFTQNWDHHAFVARTFYRRLVPGLSVLIHQDYLHTVCYWLHVFMEFYADCFELISPKILNSSAAWLSKKPLPAEACERGLNERLPFKEQLALLDRSIARYDGTQRGLLLCARTRMLWRNVGLQTAQEHAAQLSAEYANDSLVLPHVKIVVNELAGSPTQSLADPWRAKVRQFISRIPLLRGAFLNNWTGTGRVFWSRGGADSPHVRRRFVPSTALA